jgi:dihydrofolate reductase
MDEGGEIKSQQAEIESNEWTLSLSVTQQIEEYWNNYKESKDDNIAIECGKYLVDQIFNNTRDDGKVIKKTE